MQTSYVPDNRNYYIKVFCISENIAKHKDVRIIAEASDKPPFPQDGLYFVKFFLEVGDYGIRDFLVGCGFGEESMNQDEMDEAIESFLSNTIEHIDDDVELYLREVEVLEAYM